MKVRDIMLKVVKSVFNYDSSIYKAEENVVFYGRDREFVITITPNYNKEKKIYLFVDDLEKNSVQFMYKPPYENIHYGVRAHGKTQLELAISITECLMHYYWGDWLR